MVEATDVLTGSGERAGAVERLRAWLASRTFGSLSPTDVTVQREEDVDGRLAWFLDVTLPDPVPGEDTWPVEDLFTMDREVRDAALSLGVPWPWYLRVRPVSDDVAEAPAGASDASGSGSPPG